MSTRATTWSALQPCARSQTLAVPVAPRANAQWVHRAPVLRATAPSKDWQPPVRPNCAAEALFSTAPVVTQERVQAKNRNHVSITTVCSWVLPQIVQIPPVQRPAMERAALIVAARTHPKASVSPTSVTSRGPVPTAVSSNAVTRLQRALAALFPANAV